MLVAAPGARLIARTSVMLLLTPVLLVGAASFGGAQELTHPAGRERRPPITLVVRDATTGLPLDGASVMRTSAGGAPVLVARTGADGRATLLADVLAAAAGRSASGASLLVQRLGYSPQTVSAQALATHLQAHAAEVHDVALSPRPTLLSTIGVEAERSGRLAAGTALSMTTAERALVAEQAATSLAESLDGLEGVTTSRVGAWGSKLSVRGLGGERLAFMVDGARINRACVFGMDQGLATVEPSAVERVEILA
ncbi:MAG TPA: Plug domain-containing protein, partial [Gemmatimonadaceae bacterium]|nr:Plug domain-containing protein [Gemmatimonadaceae bacterium]